MQDNQELNDHWQPHGQQKLVSTTQLVASVGEGKKKKVTNISEQNDSCQLHKQQKLLFTAELLTLARKKII